MTSRNVVLWPDITPKINIDSNNRNKYVEKHLYIVDHQFVAMNSVI